jgi:hypothetical protein
MEIAGTSKVQIASDAAIRIYMVSIPHQLSAEGGFAYRVRWDGCGAEVGGEHREAISWVRLLFEQLPPDQINHMARSGSAFSVSLLSVGLAHAICGWLDMGFAGALDGGAANRGGGYGLGPSPFLSQRTCEEPP